jgi:hypothetical protein
MTEVRKYGETIKVSFPYNRDYIAMIKTIEGRKWHPEGRYWSVPYSDNIITPSPSQVKI